MKKDPLSVNQNSLFSLIFASEASIYGVIEDLAGLIFLLQLP